MKLNVIAEGLYQISMTAVNAFLLEDGARLTLIDAGLPGAESDILEAIRALGHAPNNVKQILVSHCHADHTGGLAAIKAATGAKVYMHPADAELTKRGISSRPSDPAPGALNRIMYWMMSGRGTQGIEACQVDGDLQDGQMVDVAGGLQVVHTPGHTLGHLVFIWPRHKVLIATDVAANMFGLGYPPIFEDLDEGNRSLGKLGAMDFAIACFGHGGPIMEDAAAAFDRKWGQYRTAN